MQALCRPWHTETTPKRPRAPKLLRLNPGAVTNTRRDLSTFFSLLHSAASDFGDRRAVPERVIESLRVSYGTMVRDIDCLETECLRLQEQIGCRQAARKV
jgi:hypothetical protein